MNPATAIKVCTKCRIDKPLSCFSVRKNSKIGFISECKTCTAKRSSEYRASNLKRVAEIRHKSRGKHRNQLYEKLKQWRTLHPDLLRKIEERYRAKHPLQIREKNRQWKLDHSEEIKQIRYKWFRKYNSTVAGNLRLRIGTAIWRSLRNLKNGLDWETLVGYTVEDLKKHLESRFTDGMTWERYLNGKIHVDHIFPLSRLIIDGIDDPTFKFAWSLGNLQPLWKEDNLRKNAKVV